MRAETETMSDADAPAEGIELTPTGFTVHVREKRSLGDYENTEPHATVEGEIDAEGDIDAIRPLLRARLLRLHRDLQAVVETAADNRVAAPDHEDWSDPRREATDASQ